jgi:hypothetical protein
MSGGSMGYRHEQVRTVLDDYGTLFELKNSDGYPSAVRRSFREFLEALDEQLQATAAMLKAIELEDSGDASPEATYEAWFEFQKVAGKLEWPK